MPTGIRGKTFLSWFLPAIMIYFALMFVYGALCEQAGAGLLTLNMGVNTAPFKIL